MRPAQAPLLYFQHIPKTSGTTSLGYLKAMFGDSAVYDGGIWDNLIQRPLEDLRAFQVYWGHFLGLLDGYIGAPTIKVTLLRDPLDRTISHYLHVRRTEDHPLHAIACLQTLNEFVNDPRTRWMVENYQARYLYLCDVDVRSLYRGFEAPVGVTGMFQQEVESLPLPGLSEARLFEVTSRRLKMFLMADSAERCTPAMGDLAELLGRAVRAPVGRARQRPEDQKLPPLTRALVRSIGRATEVDRALYELVRHTPIRNPAAAAALLPC